MAIRKDQSLSSGYSTPSPIGIELPLPAGTKTVNAREMMTYLFPRYARLNAAAHLIDTYAADPDEAVVVSPGCGPAAADYSLASVYNKQGSGSKLRIYGLEKNVTAYNVALSGSFILPFSRYVGSDGQGHTFIREKIFEDAQVLRNHGFVVNTSHADRDPRQSFFGGFGYKVSGRPIEKNHDFVFGNWDVINRLPLRYRGLADLVQAVGVLSTLKGDAILDFARTSALMAKESGVVHFGEPETDEMRRTMGRVAAMLKDELGLRPVDFDDATEVVPVAFAHA